ncbi:hypothetical protein T05_14111 [Trichinella murrelli]|uniref:Uncharacterized protein n=1 Tax=Trichinella murrelli TaxID=144512 RepID=A0A0V0T683_9BILA|nr:hypothetical protein T05_14111 [Trichinella murrelli]
MKFYCEKVGGVSGEIGTRPYIMYILELIITWKVGINGSTKKHMETNLAIPTPDARIGSNRNINQLGASGNPTAEFMMKSNCGSLDIQVKAVDVCWSSFRSLMYQAPEPI